ncbi:hypothetical protein [uncultured Brevundimonas sp.]|uniref:hypothetical protein n=1 Tax=uncultured Brevundimonas sp. TaxID=213418 RepID=UPI00261D7ACA|nr:hypothetical protein [uncultured Brevundimonas sp.]
MRDRDYGRGRDLRSISNEPKNELIDIGEEFDFYADEAATKQEAEAQQLALSLSQIIGGHVELKLFLQQLKASLSAKEKREAERLAALSRMTVDPSSVEQAAMRGAQTGAAHQLSSVASHFEQATNSVESLKQALLRDRASTAKDRSLWIRGAIAAVIAMSCASLIAGGSGFIAGQKAGADRGYAEARDEVAAASWANTPNARFARQLDQDGSLTAMRECSGKQWRRMRMSGQHVCFAGAVSAGGSLQGWRVPK